MTQRELLSVVHRGSCPGRLRKNADGSVNPERVYVATWSRMNRESDILALLLSERPNERAAYSRRDAYVAATIIQWLGTNVGRGFVLGCERQIEIADEAMPGAQDGREKQAELFAKARARALAQRLAKAIENLPDISGATP